MLSMASDDMRDMWTKPVPELKYVNAENVARYRLIMRYFYKQYQRLRYWLKPEEIFQGVQAYELLDDYTMEQCQNDLETLTEWGNLTHRHDGGRSTTVEEYFRKKFRYLLTPYSIEIERMLENLEQVQGYGGSLEPSLFEKIAAQLKEITTNPDTFAEGQALEHWRELLQSFTQLHENASDYLASLQTGEAEELMMTEAFLVFKDTLTHYLHNFIQALQSSSYQIEGYLRNFGADQQKVFLESVLADQQRLPNLEEQRSEEEQREQLHAEWASFRRWFLGEGGEFSDLYYLEEATKETIARVVRSVLRIQEKHRLGVSRKGELDYLGHWFFQLDELEDAKKLSAYTYGLYKTRHYQGLADHEDDSGKGEMWKEAPMIQQLRSRSRKRIHEQGSEPVRQTKVKQQKSREEYLQKRQQEEAMIQSLVSREEVKLSALGEISIRLRDLLLYWIGRCLSQESRKIRTADGIDIKMVTPGQTDRTTLVCTDGALELPDYQFIFHATDDKETRDDTMETVAQQETAAAIEL